VTTFLEHIYPWFPIIEPNFGDTVQNVLDENVSPSATTCLVMTVAAIGEIVGLSNSTTITIDQPESKYIQSALSMLPMVMLASDITSVQCLVMFSIYFYCLFKPLRAHDFVLMASMKAQNLWKRSEPPFHKAR
jgi:hypothetical protein